MNNTYKDIKNTLMKDENIQKVEVNSYCGLITITPAYNKSFMNILEVVENFLNDSNEIFINGKKFRLFDWRNFNTTVYSVTLREA